MVFKRNLLIDCYAYSLAVLNANHSSRDQVSNAWDSYASPIRRRPLVLVWSIEIRRPDIFLPPCLHCPIFMSTRTLWCIVEGQSTPFEVTVPSDATIGQLKKKVHQEKHKLTFRQDIGNRDSSCRSCIRDDVTLVPLPFLPTISHHCLSRCGEQAQRL